MPLELGDKTCHSSQTRRSSTFDNQHGPELNKNTRSAQVLTKNISSINDYSAELLLEGTMYDPTEESRNSNVGELTMIRAI